MPARGGRVYCPTMTGPAPWITPPPSVWKRLWHVAVLCLSILSGAYFVLVVFLYFRQSGMLYVPDRQLATDPGAARLAFDDVELVAADGVRLHGWWVPAEGDSRCWTPSASRLTSG